MLAGFLLWAGVISGVAQPVPLDSPSSFFTNIANRLLANAGYTFTVDHIQIWPENHYTPSVHRLLQVAANLYDASTNRVVSDYPYFPTVFRPVFGRRGADTNIYIIGYGEVTNAGIVGVGPGGPVPIMRDLQDPRQRANLGMNLNDMVYGIPLVIGAKKGFPNFNQFAMETKIQLARKLEIERRPVGSTTIYTNQMLLLCISNVFGMEAWNSYTNAYPRRLQMIVAAETFTTVSNVIAGATTLLMTNWVARIVNTIIPANTWFGYQASGAFKLPFDPLTNGFLLTNAAYVSASGTLTSVTGATFEVGFPATPEWLLYLRTRVRFVLVDVDVNPNRIVDYVNLDSIEGPLNISDLARTNRSCDSPAITGTYVPDGSAGSLWCTNRDGPAPLTPTHGVRNQIGICLGNLQPELNADQWNDPKTGIAVVGVPTASFTTDAINFFRGQIFNVADPSSRSNRFYAPYQPMRRIYFLTSWEANDPLVHYTISDLTDPMQWRNRIQFDTTGNQSRMSNLGVINTRYSPWGPRSGSAGNDPYAYNRMVKDSLIAKSDDWAFPTNDCLSIGWLGRVHRGTPWQTIYLKAGVVTNDQWIQYSGNYLIVTNWGQIATNRVPAVSNLIGSMSFSNAILKALTRDAYFTHPTNDWHLASLLAPLFNTNLPGNLLSLNQSGTGAWSAALDGMTVITLPRSTEFDTVMSSTSAPTAGIALALETQRMRRPYWRFNEVGDLLATPELSIASPWLSPVSSNYLDVAYEAIPAQLLMRLRPDSVGTATQDGGTCQFRFTGTDAYAYAIQASTNLIDWTPVSTNYPANGSFIYCETPAPESPPRFYRSVLVQ